MTLLKNQRYNAFESNPARDAYRGLPIQQFPWVIETFEHKNPRGELCWTVEVSCLAATPSGFGAKLNLELQARAALAAGSIAKYSYPPSEHPSRIGLLFGDQPLKLTVNEKTVIEASLEALPKVAKEFGQKFQLKLDNHWHLDKVQRYLKQQLTQGSPGGFGQQ